MPRFGRCEWCGSDLDKRPGHHVSMRIESRVSFYTDGRFCDPSCLRSWLDGHVHPSARPQMVQP